MSKTKTNGSAEFHIPVPPSANHLFANRGSAGRFKAKPYRDWIKDAGTVILSQGRVRFTGPVTVAIKLKEYNRRADCDNKIKPILDLLVTMEIIPDDDSRFVRKVSAEWGGERPCAVLIEVVS